MCFPIMLSSHSQTELSDTTESYICFLELSYILILSGRLSAAHLGAFILSFPSLRLIFPCL